MCDRIMINRIEKIAARSRPSPPASTDRRNLGDLNTKKMEQLSLQGNCEVGGIYHFVVWIAARQQKVKVANGNATCAGNYHKGGSRRLEELLKLCRALQPY